MSSTPKTASDSKPKDQPQVSKKTNKVLEEDDEFEDFPAEDWSDTETDGKSGKSKNLWEESWDDDETTDDFAAQLRNRQWLR
ncbi:26 proteasome-like protein complex subunit Sem1 [Tricharina praecox]|uniref:26 proteasome-like protein complex subunit Sem1 n=1 Tax=Tricharina praecox TaxID=43433 RepID=UPI00221E4F73|nr:26 proteasome-like protein complex subunit Sem1 [Tricharina praecox]KAI5855974.1 26 proteasome-like protein complex subunit Sem1 [Tricharina praecox]